MKGSRVVHEKGWWETWWGQPILLIATGVIVGLIVWAVTRHYDRASNPTATQPPLQPPQLELSKPQEKPQPPAKQHKGDTRRKLKLEQHGEGTGAVGGSIEQGPCSIAQIGGSGNTATTNCAPPSRVLDDRQAEKFRAALKGTQGTVAIFPDGTDADVIPLAKQLCDLFREGWSANCFGVPGYSAFITASLPSGLVGLHCYLANASVKTAFQNSGLKCVYESGQFTSANGVTLGALTVLIGNEEK